MFNKARERKETIEKLVEENLKLQKNFFEVQKNGLDYYKKWCEACIKIGEQKRQLEEIPGLKKEILAKKSDNDYLRMCLIRAREIVDEREETIEELENLYKRQAETIEQQSSKIDSLFDRINTQRHTIRVLKGDNLNEEVENERQEKRENEPKEEREVCQERGCSGLGKVSEGAGKEIKVKVPEGLHMIRVYKDTDTPQGIPALADVIGFMFNNIIDSLELNVNTCNKTIVECPYHKVTCGWNCTIKQQFEREKEELLK